MPAHTYLTNDTLRAAEAFAGRAPIGELISEWSRMNTQCVALFGVALYPDQWAALFGPKSEAFAMLDDMGARMGLRVDGVRRALKTYHRRKHAVSSACNRVARQAQREAYEAHLDRDHDPERNEYFARRVIEAAGNLISIRQNWRLI